MSDGWRGLTRLSIIIVMVFSDGKNVFLKSVDTSYKIKNHEYIYKVLYAMVKEVGKKIVVHIVTDNGSAYNKVGHKLKRRYHLYWTPCAAHCIYFMLEDVGKRATFAEVVKNSREVTKFIYNQRIVLSKMRDEG